MSREAISSLILSDLATERRVVVADWRFHVLYLRIAKAKGFRLPDQSASKQQIRKMLRNGEIAEIPKISGVYKVVVPYASSIASPDEAIVQEANPTAVLSHFTALSFHALTDEIPHSIFAVHCHRTTSRLPLGTKPDDWIDLPPAPARKPNRVGERSVVWSTTKPEWDFGHVIGYVESTPVYITDLERTLIDAFRFPEKCGGISEVLRAWGRAIGDVNVNRLVEYVDRIGQVLLRQRVGFTLELLGAQHEQLDVWARKVQRGSSAKLVANDEFSPNHSVRWSLSINVPDSVLASLQG